MDLEDQLALAVLRKEDQASIRALVDRLLEQWGDDAIPLPPVHKITCSLDRLRIIVYFDIFTHAGDPIRIDREAVRESMVRWLNGDLSVIGVQGCQRIELYELPDRPPPMTSNPNG